MKSGLGCVLETIYNKSGQSCFIETICNEKETDYFVFWRPCVKKRWTILKEPKYL